YNADGSPKTAGTVLTNPALAVTFKQIADGGANAFYKGKIAHDIVAKVQTHPSNPGLLTKQDIANYRAKVRNPVCSDYRQWTICGAPPPSSGGIAIAQMLGILEAQPKDKQINKMLPIKNSMGWLEPTPLAAHLFSEAGRLAYADRAQYVADPAFAKYPGGSWKSLIDKNYLAQRAQLITDKSMGKAQAGTPAGMQLSWAKDKTPELPSTSHISAVDKFGQAASITTSIEDQFGSRQMVDGFLLNNQLTDFSFPADENGQLIANRVEAGKRPRSSMSPVLVFDKASKKLVMTAGAPGGASIINYVAKTLVGTLDWGLNVQQAIALPNVGSRNGPTELELGRTSPALAAGLV
ncbi:MAG: gamma-glutamyltransferase, partial [Glaciimonas sp.]|nr:gamma-glutamyltransferase [Glaciimonas sp.]